MKKGLVLELKEDYAVIGNHGKYYRIVRRDDMEIGQQILYIDDDIVAMKSKKNK